jgi:hypothetical protein
VANGKSLYKKIKNDLQVLNYNDETILSNSLGCEIAYDLKKKLEKILQYN